MYTHKGKHIKSGLKLIGGKTKIRDVLYSMFPKDYTCYFEPFGGSFNVLVGSPKVPYESVNDLNSCAVLFMSHLRDHPEELWQHIKADLALVNSDDFDFYKFRDAEPPLGGVENASWFYIVTKLAMNGIYRRNKLGKCNSSYCKTKNGRGFFTEEWFWNVHNRIKDLRLYNMDFREYITNHVNRQMFKDEYSRKFVFLDPPYYKVKTTYNGLAFKDQDFIDLFNILKQADYDWMLTINDHPWIREQLSGFNIHEHLVGYSCSQTNSGRGLKKELIITNYGR